MSPFGEGRIAPTYSSCSLAHLHFLIKWKFKVKRSACWKGLNDLIKVLLHITNSPCWFDHCHTFNTMLMIPAEAFNILLTAIFQFSGGLLRTCDDSIIFMKFNRDGQNWTVYTSSDWKHNPLWASINDCMLLSVSIELHLVSDSYLNSRLYAAISRSPLHEK